MTATTEIKARAKVIFGRAYNYPAVPLRSIGRQCFAWAMAKARQELSTEARDAARLAHMPAKVRALRARKIRASLELLPMIDSWPAVVAARAELETELRRLAC